MVWMMKKLAADRNSLDPPPIKALRLVHLPVYNRYRYQPCIITRILCYCFIVMLRLIFYHFLSTNNIFSGLCSSERTFGSYCPLLSLGLLQIHGTQGTLVPKRDSCFDFGPTRDSCFNFGPQGAFVPSLVPQGTLVSNLARSVLGVRCPHPYHIFVIFSTLSPFYGLEIVRQEYVNLHQSSLATKTLYNFIRNFFEILWMNFTHSNPLRIYLVKLCTCSLPTSWVTNISCALIEGLWCLLLFFPAANWWLPKLPT